MWKFVRQAPLAGTSIGWSIMPNYVGNYLLFNKDGKTGEDRSIEGYSVPFGYQLVVDENGKLIFDPNDIPLGTGYQGAQYFIIVLNSTTLIINEVGGSGRYAELER